MIKRFTFLILLVSLFGWAENTPDTRKWAEEVLRNPTSYFVNAYEREIFQRFQGKFPNLTISGVEQLGGLMLMEVEIGQATAPYQLNMEIDDKYHIRRIHRNLPSLKKHRNLLDERSLEWLGRFLYRIDAGDSAALMDLLFYENVQIRYKDLGSKREISRQLLDDFPGIVETRNIALAEKQGVLDVQIDTQLFSGLSVRIPLNLMEDRDTALQQEDLFKRLSAILKSSRTASDQPVSIPDFYPEATLAGQSVVVPYLIERVATLKEIQYQLLSGIGTGADASIELERVNPSTLLMNDMLLIDYHGAGAADEDALGASTRFVKSLYNLFGCRRPDTRDAFHSDLSGKIRYRGYQLHELPLTDPVTWRQLLKAFGKEGQLYYYPSRIDYRADLIKVRGLLYITPNRDAEIYHFAEVIATAQKREPAIHTQLDLILYPFVKSNHVSSMGGNF